MGGHVDVESSPGIGTIVRVTLQLPAATPPTLRATTTAAPEPKPGAGVRILIAEDDRVGRMVASAVLEGFGASVVLAENGRVALERAEAQPFDLILMDIQMPELDGLEATRRIRAGAGPNCGARICALSANAFGDDVTRSLDAGMDGHLPTPFNRDALADVVRSARP